MQEVSHHAGSAAGSAVALFVYGSLARPRMLDAVLGRVYRGERLRARLSGFQRVSSAAYPHPFLVEQPGAAVDGILLLDLTEQDLTVLDAYEDVSDDVYRRIAVEVEAWGCGPRPLPVPAYTYVAGPNLAGAHPSTAA